MGESKHHVQPLFLLPSESRRGMHCPPGIPGNSWQWCHTVKKCCNSQKYSSNHQATAITVTLSSTLGSCYLDQMLSSAKGRCCFLEQRDIYYFLTLLLDWYLLKIMPCRMLINSCLFWQQCQEHGNVLLFGLWTLKMYKGSLCCWFQGSRRVLLMVDPVQRMCFTYGCLYLAPSVRVHLPDERLFASTLGAGREVFIPLSTLIKVSDVTKALGLYWRGEEGEENELNLNSFLIR